MSRIARLGSSLALLVAAVAPAIAADRPNVVYILADDLGIGDVRAFHPASKIPTPSIDRLAARGMRFTDAHSGSAVCTPTRYGLLTGRYAWRSRLERGVLGGYSPPLIGPGRLTVAELLRREGYATACVGKWHLGLDWEKSDPRPLGDAIEPLAEIQATVDYALPFRGGPTALGFEQFFGIAASLDMPPYVFLRDDRCVGLPTAEKTWIRTGPAHPDFEAVDVLPALAGEAVAFLEGRAAAADGRPFFLYLPLTAPHTPVVPSPDFRGRGPIGPYGDFVIEVDAAVGRVVDALGRLGLTERTLVIVSSDNGFAPAAGLAEIEAAGHRPSAQFRGHKADIFEGGHRVPFVACWPGVVAEGSTHAGPVGLGDLMATLAEILGQDLPPDAGEDSVSFLPALRGEAGWTRPGPLVHHSIDGTFAIREGRWKLIFGPDSGGWSHPRPGRDPVDGLPTLQLYDLDADPGERENRQADHFELVHDLAAKLEQVVGEGRSTPGPRRPNDVPVKVTARGRR